MRVLGHALQAGQIAPEVLRAAAASVVCAALGLPELQQHSRTHALVKRRAGHSSVYRLGFWALNATAAGLAMVQDGVVTTRNARWHEMEAYRGGWVREGSASSSTNPHRQLSQIAVLEAGQLPQRRLAAAVHRYRALEGGQVIELRMERIASRAALMRLARSITTRSVAIADTCSCVLTPAWRSPSAPFGDRGAP